MIGVTGRISISEEQVRPEDVPAVLDGAADDLIESGWTQDTLYAADGRKCLMGAVIMSLKTFYGVPIVRPDVQRVFCAPVLDALQENGPISAFFPISEDGGRWAIEAWNDAEGRRKSEVVEVLRRAAILAKESA